MYFIQFAIVFKFQLYFVFFHLGTLGMSAKKKKDIRQKSLESAQALGTPKKNDVRRCITGRAMLKDDMCSMKIHVYMLHNNHWYLHCNSCLDHCNHPPLLAKAKAKSSMDMSPGSKSLVSITISKVSSSIQTILLTFHALYSLILANYAL